jgi:hypothetical protein
MDGGQTSSFPYVQYIAAVGRRQPTAMLPFSALATGDATVRGGGTPERVGPTVRVDERQ